MGQRLPHRLRFATVFIGSMAGFGLISVAWFTLWGWLLAIVIFWITHKFSEYLFRLTASEETRRADLEDRVRNPPS